MIEFLRKIMGYTRPYRTRLVLGLAAGILYALANAALPVAIKIVPDLILNPDGAATLRGYLDKAPEFIRHLVGNRFSEVNSPDSKTGILLVMMIIPLVVAIRALFSYLNIYLMYWVAVRAVADLRNRLFAHLQNLSSSFFNTSSTGELLSRITNDTSLLQNTISSSFAVIIKDPIGVLSMAAVLVVMQPRLTGIAMLVFPICVVPVVVYGRKMGKSSAALQRHMAELTKLMHEAFTANRIVKAYNLEATVAGQFQDIARKHVSEYMRVVRAHEVPGPLIECAAGLGLTLVLIYVKFFSPTPISAGDLFQFVVSLLMLYQPIKAITRLKTQLEQARAASLRVFELLEEQPRVAEPANPVPLQAARQPIRFQGIEFHYGEKSPEQRAVLRDIDLTIQPGQLVALVGSSGSGKTTLTNLLLRFYDPQKGSVRIGETDIRAVSTRELRRQIAVVTQETILFNDTIRNNIALGRPGATAAEIEAAALHAHAHEFIVEKPQGYDTLIGEKGVSLSGGQRQRLAIARAILKDAPILILDEATSALDSEIERVVQSAFEELMQGRTTISIAHRLSTIQKADMIVVMDQGRIVEVGRHAELLRRGGHYQKLHALQFASESVAS